MIWSSSSVTFRGRCAIWWCSSVTFCVRRNIWWNSSVAVCGRCNIWWCPLAEHTWGCQRVSLRIDRVDLHVLKRFGSHVVLLLSKWLKLRYWSAFISNHPLENKCIPPRWLGSDEFPNFPLCVHYTPPWIHTVNGRHGMYKTLQIVESSEGQNVLEALHGTQFLAKELHCKRTLSVSPRVQWTKEIPTGNPSYLGSKSSFALGGSAYLNGLPPVLTSSQAPTLPKFNISFLEKFVWKTFSFPFGPWFFMPGSESLHLFAWIWIYIYI